MYGVVVFPWAGFRAQATSSVILVRTVTARLPDVQLSSSVWSAAPRLSQPRFPRRQRERGSTSCRVGSTRWRQRRLCSRFFATTFRTAFSIWLASGLLLMLGVIRAERMVRTAVASPRDSQRCVASQVIPGIREGSKKVSTRNSNPPFNSSSERFLVWNARTMWWNNVGIRR